MHWKKTNRITVFAIRSHVCIHGFFYSKQWLQRSTQVTKSNSISVAISFESTFYFYRLWAPEHLLKCVQIVHTSRTKSFLPRLGQRSQPRLCSSWCGTSNTFVIESHHLCVCNVRIFAISISFQVRLELWFQFDSFAETCSHVWSEEPLKPEKIVSARSDHSPPCSVFNMWHMSVLHV